MNSERRIKTTTRRRQVFRKEDSTVSTCLQMKEILRMPQGPTVFRSVVWNDGGTVLERDEL